MNRNPKDYELPCLQQRFTDAVLNYHNNGKVGVEYAGTVPAETDLSLAGNPIGPSPKIDFFAAAKEFSFRPNAYPQLAGLLVKNLAVSEDNIDFVRASVVKDIGGSLLNFFPLPQNIIVLRSFSKAHGFANYRIGYAVGDHRVINSLRQDKVPFHVSDLQTAVAIMALDDPERLSRNRDHMAREVPKIIQGLRKIGFPYVTEYVSNLILARIPPFFESASEPADILFQQGVSIVCCGNNFGVKS